MSDYLKIKKHIEKIISESSGNICLSFYDLDDEEGFSVNEDKKVRSASMIKLLIMAEIMNQSKNGKISLDTKIKVGKKDKVGGSGILKEFDCEHEFSIKELMTLMIIVSDNQATNILIDLVGMDNINLMGKRLNLKSASLQRKMMDIKALEKGRDNYISAKDVKVILEKIYRKTLVDEKSSELMLDILLRQHERQRLGRFLDEEVKIASKTGDLDKLENDGGIFFLENKNYILVVLIDDAVTNAMAQETIGKISKYIYDEMGR